DQVDDRPPAGRRRRGRGDLQHPGDPGSGGAAHHQPGQPGRRLRPRLRARRGARHADRRGGVQLLRFRRHQRLASVPAVQRLMPSWVDGRPAAELPLGDRGLAYGDGLFETFAVRRGRPCLLDEHLRRLRRGCERLGLAFEEQAIVDELLAFCATLGEGVAKLILTRGDGLRGYAPPADARPRRVLLASPAPVYPDEYAQLGVELYPCALRLAEQPLLAGLKHLNRLEQALARAEWRDSRYAEGLLRDAAGRVIEGVFSNLFLVSEGRLLTPALERCGVAGVMRGALLREAAAL